MFRNNTVFILGAGASWHYGYPTGEGLVDSVISMAKRLSSYCENRLKSGQVVQLIPEYVVQRTDPKRGFLGAREGWTRVRDECQELISRLETVRPLVIDYFLAWNVDLQPIGKLMIAAAIFECEVRGFVERANWNRRLQLENGPRKTSTEGIDFTKYDDHWYRFIVHKLVYGCSKSAELLTNNVRFVTFNYDASLEYHLYRALCAIDFLDDEDVDTFLTRDRIVHVYGSVRERIPRDGDAIDLRVAQILGKPFAQPIVHENEFGLRKEFLDRCLKAADNLHTIDPDDKEADKTTLESARRWVADAGVVYILGYGFDDNNNRRIGLMPSLCGDSRKDKAVMFTNFGDLNTINKKASKLFYGSYEWFLGKSVHGRSTKGDYVEKSVRTVYEALEMDFDALEGELMWSTKI